MVHNRFAVIGISLFVCFFVSSLIGSFMSFAVCVILAAAAVICGFVLKNKAVVFAASAAAAAFLFYGIYSAVFIEPTASLKDTTTEVTATVISTGRPGGDTAFVTAEGSANGIPVRFSFYTPTPGIDPGDTVTADVTFSGLTSAASYSDSYNYSRGIYLRAYAENTSVTDTGAPDLQSMIAGFSERLRTEAGAQLAGDETGLLLAVCFGDKSRLSDRLSAEISGCGLSHFTAVSGMHISLIILTILAALKLLPFGKNRILRFVTVVVLAAVFMVFFNMTASVRRSGIMLIFFIAAELFRRERSTLNSLGAALTLILLSEPYACRDTGLLLSACGTFGAGVVAPALSELIAKRHTLSSASTAVITCVCATFCTIPVSALTFGGFSLLSPVITPLMLPFFAAALIFTMLFAVSGGTLGFLLIPAGAALKPVIAAVDGLSQLRYGYISADGEIFPWFMILSGVFIAAVVILVHKRRLGKRFIGYSLAAVFCALIGIVTADRITGRDTAVITVYSDGDGFLAALGYRSGVSLFASGTSEKLSAEAYSTLAERSIDRFDLICVLAPGNRGEAYSEAFSSLPALERHFTGNSEYECDVGGLYSVSIYEDAMIVYINGVSVILSDVSSAPVYGGQDIAVYGGYKRSENYAVNGTTILTSKKYKEPEGAYNAYYNSIEIRIDPDGRTRVLSR